jgi:act minimal PKS acyl carrier protein
MSQFTTEDFKRIVRVTVGVDDSVDLDGDILDTSFSELGYDSLAVLEIANKIKKEFGVAIPDEAIPDLATPRMTIDYVNDNGMVRP